MKHTRLFLITFTLFFYVFGAAFVESFVNYPSWRVIGPNEFVAYHHLLAPRIVGLMVVPGVLGSLLTVALIWFRPAVIPRWGIWTVVGLHALMWTSTATIQIPIQAQFSAHGFSEELLTRLIVTNFWLRRVPSVIQAGLFLWFMHRVINAGQISSTR